MCGEVEKGLVGEPVVSGEQSVAGVASLDGPHAVVLYSVGSVGDCTPFDLALFLLQDGLELVVAGDVVGALLVPEDQTQGFSLGVQLRTGSGEGLFDACEGVGEEAAVGSDDEGPDLHSRKEVDWS